jgi:hypothetical protein
LAVSGLVSISTPPPTTPTHPAPVPAKQNHDGNRARFEQTGTYMDARLRYGEPLKVEQTVGGGTC